MEVKKRKSTLNAEEMKQLGKISGKQVWHDIGIKMYEQS